MHSATFTELADGIGVLQVVDPNGHHVGEIDFTAREDGPNRGSLLGTANEMLREIGWQLDYGWMFDGVDADGHPYRRGPVVRLGERTSVWD